MSEIKTDVTRRRILTAGGAAALSVTGPARLAGAQSRGSDTSSQSGSRPNLIFYFPDELRADALSSYGNPVDFH